MDIKSINKNSRFFSTIKKDFPIFLNQPELVYLDSTATALKPKTVVDKLREYYEEYSANVFRGVYKISEKATEEYEDTRKIIGEFINAKKSEEIIFTRGSTESLNLVAYSMGRKIINQGDEIVTSIMEHHSNFVPWQVLAGENGGAFKVVDITDGGHLDIGLENIKYKNSKFKNLEQIITKKTKILTLTYISNVLGTINPIKEIIRLAKSINPKLIVVIDAAQAVPHLKIDVKNLGCDFLVFSSHKMLGPTGVGVLWGKYELLDEMFPFNFGGEMIQEVYIDKTIFKKPPHKFEAGTPHIAGVIALKEAVKYLEKIGIEKIRDYEIFLSGSLARWLEDEFKTKLKILGPDYGGYPEDRAGIISFTFGKYHPHDIAQILDGEQIAVRAGHHCAMPLHNRLGINASVRASFYIYNTIEDVSKLVKGLKKVEIILR